MRTSASVVPLAKVNEHGQLLAFLGSGYVVGQEPVVVTAKHVLEDAQLESGERFAVVPVHARPGLPTGGVVEELEHHVLGAPQFSPKYDIAAMDARGVPGLVSLPVSSSDPYPDESVLLVEYSPSGLERDSDGSLHLMFDSFIHKGNIVRYYISDGRASTLGPVLQTSFPALRGASGAPVLALRASGYAVAGMIVGNTERPLVPAQIEPVATESGSTEMIRYFLPFGLALQRCVIAEFLSSIDVSVQFSE